MGVCGTHTLHTDSAVEVLSAIDIGSTSLRYAQAVVFTMKTRTQKGGDEERDKFFIERRSWPNGPREQSYKTATFAQRPHNCGCSLHHVANYVELSSIVFSCDGKLMVSHCATNLRIGCL